MIEQAGIATGDRAEGLRLDPAEVGLIVVDMQNGFCHPEGSRGQAAGPDAVSKPRAIIPAVVRCIRMAHDAGVPVWLTRQVHYPEDRTRERRRIPSHLDRGGTKLKLCWRETWDAELVDEVQAELRPEDEIVVKHRSSAFYNTTLESELRMRGIQVLIVTGTTTSYCVESTVRDAYARDFDVVVPADAVADTEDAAQRASLYAIDRFHGLVTTIDGVARMLGVRDPPSDS